MIFVIDKYHIFRFNLMMLRLHAIVASAAVLLACQAPELPPEPFCDTLVALGEGRIDVQSDNPNEMVGFVATLEALLDVAPRAVRADLETVRDKFAAARDASGWRTLIDFADMQKPELAAAEGRVTEYVADECGISIDEPGAMIDEPDPDKTLCPAWPRACSPLMNNRFPYLIATAAANYFAATYWSVPFVPAPPGFIDVPRGGRIVFEGEYPYTRYFAFHPNDYETNNFDTLVDHQLDPDPGSVNPWREPQTADKQRRYTAQLVFGPEPTQPEPNTRYVGETRDGRFNPAVFLIYRIYAADQGALPPNSAGAKLPAVTILDEDGEVVEHYDECDPYPEGTEAPRDNTRFPAFPVPDHRSAFNPGGMNTNNNWGMPVTLLANRDVRYISTFYSRNHGEVFVVRGKKPRTPSLKHGIPLYSEETDIRLWTVCTYNLWNGAANACMTDEDIPVDADGYYTLVATAPSARPANATRDAGFAWLDTGNFIDGQLTYRTLLSNDDLVERIARAIDTGVADAETEPYVPRTAFCSRKVFEREGADGCFAAWEDERA